MAIVKSYLRQQRYRSLAEGEEVWFDLAKGREERLQAANVTGPEGKHVIGTPIVIHRVGGRNGPRVVGIEEDVGYRRFGRFRRDRRRRAASRDQETQSSAAPDTQVSKQSNEKTTEIRFKSRIVLTQSTMKQARRTVVGITISTLWKSKMALAIVVSAVEDSDVDVAVRQFVIKVQARIEREAERPDFEIRIKSSSSWTVKMSNFQKFLHNPKQGVVKELFENLTF